MDKRRFRELLENIEYEETEESKLNQWTELKERIKRARKERNNCEEKKNGRKKRWWNKKCVNRKRELRKILEKLEVTITF